MKPLLFVLCIALPVVAQDVAKPTTPDGTSPREPRNPGGRIVLGEDGPLFQHSK